MNSCPFHAILCASALPFAASLPAAAEAPYLWQLGRADNKPTEFALAPGGFADYRQDGCHVVGSSNPQADWPYVQPGPHDQWAGSKPHSFVVVFGLKQAPTSGDGRLEIDLLDTHAGAPPKLRVDLNGHATELQLPPGGGDASVQGHPERGREHRISVPIPAGQLRAGDNQLVITTLIGSWLLYDFLGMTVPAGTELAPAGGRTVMLAATGARGLVRKDDKLHQPVSVELRQFGPPADVTLTVGSGAPLPVHLDTGTRTVEVLAPPVSEPSEVKVVLQAGPAKMETTVSLKPVPPLTVYVLPHSHTDIGYTDIQSAIEKKQVENLLAGMAEARRTASYPEGARFVWNVEVAWAADLYLQRLNDKQKTEFLEAVRSGQVVLNGMYLNQLTGLCRPEELLRLFRFATTLAKLTGRPVDSAMISDVPGYTWGTVTAMSQAGIRYFSVAPNYFDRIGTILREWENKPFYWQGPDGQAKVLVWIPFWGYAMSHRYRTMSPQLVGDFLDGLQQRSYPYDIACVRWSGHGDNAVPDAAICDFVRDWNAKYAWPHFIISGTGEAFQAFERKHGAKLPVVRGDWTPYWEDGAGSSALETGMNRASADRLAQAETMLAMKPQTTYPAKDFEAAWNAVLLYSEHTWGAWCSISEPERKETLEQWAVKKGYADEADRRSRQLYQASTGGGPKTDTFQVVNTLSWPRGGPVVLSAAQSKAGDRVVDDTGRACPSQRLKSGELLFLASEVPPLAARSFKVTQGAPQEVATAVVAEGATLQNAALKVRVDRATGGITELVAGGGNFADTSGGESLNEYLYLPGDDLKDVQKAGPATVQPGETGPLVASLIVNSAAPGCRSLKRELRLMAGADFLEIDNLVDKQRLAARNYKSSAGKESLNFAFPFAVPDGQIVLDLPWGRMRPEADQMPSACKNWFTVGRWADVSNAQRGVTWVTLDAPLVQVGGLTARLLESQTNPDVWRKTVEPTQKLYSWAMNNHWGTNYRAYQDGATRFRFVLRPHGRRDLVEATRFATGFGFPLVAADSGAWSSQPLLTVSDPAVLVGALKPADAGKATIIRLFNAADVEKSVSLAWGERKPKSVTLSDLGEDAGAVVSGPLRIPPLGLVTLRAELD